MSAGRVVLDAAGITPQWLAAVLGRGVAAVDVQAGRGNWSRQFSIAVRLDDGSTQALRLKVCPGETFGRSEVDYYTQDYVNMAAAPLVRCFDAQYESGVGYHLLLEDLAASHTDRRAVAPTLGHGLAVAAALGRLHRHRWGTQQPPDDAALDRYFDAIRPGLVPLERETSQPLQAAFARHEQALRQRWRQPHGMSLLHGDTNPTNLLTPRGADAPVLLLDRQPFDWSLTYGVAAWDLASFMVPWWPPQLRQACEAPVLRCWYEALQQADYGWEEAHADWRLAVEQCLHIPIEWCSSPATLADMRWLWTQQFERVLSALRSRPLAPSA